MAKKKTAKKKTADNGSPDIASQLAALEDAWEDAPEQTGEFETVPDGSYQCLVQKATLNNSKNSGRLQVSWDMEISSGELEGRHIFKHDGIQDADGNTNEKGLGFLKGTISKFDVTVPKKISQLPKALAQCLDSYVNVTVKTSGDFQNVYINSLVMEDGEQDGGL